MSFIPKSLSSGRKGRGRLMAGLLCALILVLGVAATAYAADWRPFPNRSILPETIGYCRHVSGPMWNLNDDPHISSSTWIYFEAYTMRPHKKRDFHLLAYNGTFYRSHILVEDDAGNRNWYVLGYGANLQDIYQSIVPYCRGYRN